MLGGPTVDPRGADCSTGRADSSDSHLPPAPPLLPPPRTRHVPVSEDREAQEPYWGTGVVREALRGIFGEDGGGLWGLR